jgi:rhombotail lipoprotein
MAARREVVHGTLVVLISALCAGCASSTMLQRRSSALELLYPKGKAAEPPRDVVLQVPLRVGLTFTPSAHGDYGQLPAQQQQEILRRVAAAFKESRSVRGVEVLPSNYLRLSSGFESVAQVSTALDLDVMALVSYEQKQFSDTDRLRSLAYWTVIGIHLVKGEKNQTHTLMDVVVYDVPSRTLLFRGAGESVIKGRAAPIGLGEERRNSSAAGFDRAADDLIANLKTSFAEFSKQAATGTVRGPGTPAIQIARAADPTPGAGHSGAGAFGFLELAVIGLIAAACRDVCR